MSLAEARKGFKTALISQESAQVPVPTPPSKVFKIVKYNAPAGKFAAYITPDPGDGKRHSAIIWITGGDCNTIGDVWLQAPVEDEQTASAYRQAGIIMMFPSLRGGNMNPGYREGFFGEVNDILAAADYLAVQKYVDPERIYLGGHSTGATLTLLIAEYSNRFRAVFSLSPVDDIRGYGPEFMPFDSTSKREVELRAPILWLHSVTSPLFVIDGMQQPGNYDCFKNLSRTSQNPNIHFVLMRNADHFSICYPINKLIASKILNDTGKTSSISITNKEADDLFDKIWSQ